MSALLILSLDNNEVFIQSLESQTIDQNPVFNKIKFDPGINRDIWMMNQSHYGARADSKDWERLAIVVDKSQNTALFLQLPPGELKWTDDLLNQQKNFRVSCFVCHASGPRAIRPDFKGIKVSMFDRVRLFIWNLRIKTYGPIKEHPHHKHSDTKLDVPFRHRAQLDNETLNVRVCTKCHSGNGLLSRATLTRQNAITIKFMVEYGHMPPLGFAIDEIEKDQIKKFISGL